MIIQHFWQTANLAKQLQQQIKQQINDIFVQIKGERIQTQILFIKTNKKDFYFQMLKDQVFFYLFESPCVLLMMIAGLLKNSSQQCVNNASIYYVTNFIYYQEA
ncbi:hypothetical protein ABPG74_012592 [Tetrahymena malaccensis]